MPRPTKLEPFKSKYTVERSAYRLDHDTNIVHLRMLSPDNGKTHVEYFSYTVLHGHQVWAAQAEHDQLRKMEYNMDKLLGNTWAMQKHKIHTLTMTVDAINEMKARLNKLT